MSTYKGYKTIKSKFNIEISIDYGKMGLDTLSEYCIQSLVQNKEQFPVIGNMPFRLLKDYLKRINISVTQLMKYEKYNVEWIFDDDEMWINFLKLDFPTNIHEQYVNNREKIIKYYKDSLRSINNLNLDEQHNVTVMMLRNKVSQAIKRDIKTHKYKIPYRMLYLQYQNDIKLKEAQVAENLRLQMQKIKEERDKKSTIAVGEKFFLDNTIKKRKHLGREPIWKPIHKREPPVESKRRQVERVAFGGMAGRKINPDAFKIVSRDPAPPRTSSSSSPTKISEPKERRSRSPPLLTTPRKLPRNSSGPNIFLNRRPRPIHRSPHKVEATNTPPNTVNQGTRKKTSSIFQTQSLSKSPLAQPHGCNTSSTTNCASTTATATTTTVSHNNKQNKSPEHQRVHSLSFYLKKRQINKTPKK